MRVPIISNIIDKRNELHNARMESYRANISASRARTQAIEKSAEQTTKAFNAILENASKPVMSLNDELYGKQQPYNTDIWQSNGATTRRVSRIAHSQSPAAQALTGRFADLVYGTNLELQAQPFFDLIPGSPSIVPEQQAIVKNIERRWWLWAKSKNSDYEQDKSYFEKSRQNFEKLLIDGEYFLLLRYSQSRKKNPLTVQYVRPENIQRIGSQVAQGNTECDGIEYDSRGVAVAYHVIDSVAGQSMRVLRYGTKSGRTFVIHVKLGSERRGIGILAGIISELTKLSDFQALEIQAAVINALFAVWVETPIGGENKSVIGKNGIGGIKTNADQRRLAPNVSEYEARLNSTDFDQGGIIVQNMGEGQKLNSFDTKRPTANFEQFFNTVKRNLYSAKGMSLAVADYNFNGSYSAARGELLVFWIRVMTLRFDSIMQRENEVYKMWLWGEIDNGNIPDYGYADEFTRDAFSNAEWTGPSQPDIDPLRSVKAHEVEAKNGWKTDEKIAAERGGGSFDDNIARKAIENKAKADANEPLMVQEKTTYSNSIAKTESKSTSITDGK
jgi:lambda family phage portal protein